MASTNPRKSKQPSKATIKKQKIDIDAAAKGPTEPTNRPQELTVVGIGASAGGLRALQSFFGALPADTGLVLVVVTHLHPEHESHMPELLQRHTKMRVRQVTRKIKVEPNNVYVIPPNRSIHMADGYLDTAPFEEPHGKRTPIDHFFRSLAQGHTESVAVILSGAGTDGSVGVKDIKEGGGLILVQDPDDAEYDSMPRATINTGLADVALPAAQLAQKLVEYSRHRPQISYDSDKLTEEETGTLQRILAQVRARTGHDFNQYKRSTVVRRLERRMQLNGFLTLEAYLNYLRHHADEARAIFNDILIGVTNFFRDHESWLALEQRVIPALFEGKAEDDELRIWSIGCATGEEAYSLAILLFERTAKLDFRPDIQIFASDLDEDAITHARNGLYPAAIEADVSAERLDRFFTREGEYYRIKHELRDAVLFTNHNVLRDPPFTRQELIVCRNVLIYLQRSIQDHVFDIFHYALNPEGYLFLGNAESAEHLPDLFSVVDKNHRLYQARPRVTERLHVPILPLMIRHGARAREARAQVQRNPSRLIAEIALEEQHQRWLEFYGPPSVLVNKRYQVLHVSDTAGRYLHQPKGSITRDLLRLVRPELQLELRTALFQAFEKEQAIVSRPVAVHFDGHPRRVVLSVRPLRNLSEMDQPTEKEALVFFLEDESEEPLEPPEPHLPHEQAERDKLIAQLESEVKQLREQLQIIGEENESSEEEMKAANEELQSLNEEYRSTTEELETSKEELQSVNEELQTVNNDMRNRLDDLARAHEELENLLGATEIGTLFLDRELRIQRFTAGVNHLINLMPGDRGRPIGHLTHRLNYDGFTADAQQVLRNLTHVEREVQTENDAWYLLRFRPFRTTADQIVGVVISFIDITDLKMAEQDLVRAKQTLEARVQERTRELDDAYQKLDQTRQLFENLFDTNPIPTSITTLEEGLFINMNEAYLEYFGLRHEDVIGRTSRELNLPIGPSLRPSLIARLQKEGPIRNLEMETKLPSGKNRIILASIQMVIVDHKNALMLAFVDITERVRAERQMRTVATSLNTAEQVDRQRISQILHDDLQQNIFAVKVQLSFLADAIARNDPGAAQTDLKQLDEWLAESIAITRQLSIDLSPPILSGEGLQEQFLWLASQMKTQYNLDVTVESNNVAATFADDVRTSVFQSVRELLFNVVKHAGTLNATIGLAKMDGQVRITVSDEGRGFDMKGLDRQISHGLRKMRDRLFLVGCTLEIESAPEQGTRITIEAPILEATT